MKASTKPKTRSRLPRMTPAWAAFKRACPKELWRPLTPLVRQALTTGVGPQDVDDALVEEILAAARKRGIANVDIIGEIARSAWNRLRQARPELDLAPLRTRERAALRGDQWNALPAALRDEIAARLDELGHSAETRETERNLLLRGLEAAADAKVCVSELADLFGKDGLMAILKHETYFGAKDAPNTSRSKIVEFGRAFLKSQRKPGWEKAIEPLERVLRKLPTRQSEVPPDMLAELDALCAPGKLAAVVAETERLVLDYVEEGGALRRGRAQVALMMRLQLATPVARRHVFKLRFDGPMRDARHGLRPTLVIDGYSARGCAEDEMTAHTVGLIDQYWATARSEGFVSDFLFTKRLGDRKDDSTYSSAVRRLGCQFGVVLTPSLLTVLAVYLLIAVAKADPTELDLIDIKDSMRIDQIVNFVSRYGKLITEDMYDQLAKSAGLQ